MLSAVRLARQSVQVGLLDALRGAIESSLGQLETA
jgi:hypothetical protein